MESAAVLELARLEHTRLEKGHCDSWMNGALLSSDTMCYWVVSFCFELANAFRGDRGSKNIKGLYAKGRAV